jgi:hypothetical protein
VAGGAESLEGLRPVVDGAFLAEDVVFLIAGVLLHVHNNFISINSYR